MRKVKRITKKLLKEINGMEVTWIGDDGLTVPAVVLADIEHGISIKPLISPEEQRELEIKHWGINYASSLATLQSPTFCLTAYNTNDLKKGSKYFNDCCRSIETILSNNAVNITRYIDTGYGDPTCPFA